MKNTQKVIKFNLITKKVKDLKVGDLYVTWGKRNFRIVTDKKRTFLHDHLKSVIVRIPDDLNNLREKDITFSGDELEEDVLVIGEEIK